MGIVSTAERVTEIILWF